MRDFTESDYQDLSQKIYNYKIKNFDTLNESHITIGYQGDIESTNYANQIANKLIADGNDIESIILFSSGNITDNYCISSAPDDSVLVEIFSKKK